MPDQEKDLVSSNFIIDSYLKSFEKRVGYYNNNNKNLLLGGKILTFIYLLLLLKYSLNLFIDFDYEIKLYLYDLSVIFGGIPKFNTIYLIFVWIFALTLNFKFRLSKDKNFSEVSAVFDVISDRKLFKAHRSDFKHANKLIRFTKLIYRATNVFAYTFCKYLL